jgi:hypothetical protein
MAKKTTFTATTSVTSSTTSGVTVDDFVAYLPKHLYIFTPCREIWVGSGVNACLPAMQVLTKSGKPKCDKDGKIIYQPATKWLDKNRGIEQATWCPGQPMLIKIAWSLTVAGSKRRASPLSTGIARRESSSATRQKPSRGSTMFIRCFIPKTTPIAASNGLPIACNAQPKRSTTAW